MNSFLEDPFNRGRDHLQLMDRCFAASFVFDTKRGQFVSQAFMEQARAKHFSCMFTDPADVTHRLALAAGGITVEKHVDLFKKSKTQTFHDSDLIEQYDFHTGQWTTFTARLAVARHSAAICELKGYLYVIGGHTVALPTDFMNTIERCPVKAEQSSFDLLAVNYNQMDLRIQSLLTMPLPDDNGIMILSSHVDDPRVNQGFFLDVRHRQMKESNFTEEIGSINHWQNSCAPYKQMTAYLTEDLQILKFDHQSCAWSTQELAEIRWVYPPETSFKAIRGEERYGGRAKGKTEGHVKDKKEKAKGKAEKKKSKSKAEKAGASKRKLARGESHAEHQALGEVKPSLAPIAAIAEEDEEDDDFEAGSSREEAPVPAPGLMVPTRSRLAPKRLASAAH